MTDTSPNGHSIASPDRPDVKPPLTAHRAVSVCAREFASVCDAVVQGVMSLHANGLAEKPAVRQAPGRSIIQLGPVAATVAWLRDSSGLIEAGELLVIVWRGAVAPRGEHIPERATVRSSSAPTVVWEQALGPVATSEAAWRWRPHGQDGDGYTSAEVAAESLERLRLAYLAAQ
jgi:hypothetical protein